MDDATIGGPDGSGDAAIPGHRQPGNGYDDPAGLQPEPDRTGRAVVAFAVIAVIVLLAGLAVWVTSGGGDDTLSSVTAPPTVNGNTVATEPTTPPSTVPTTAAATTAPPIDSTVPTTAPPVPEPSGFALPEPGAETWVVPSDFDPIAPEMTLTLIASAGDIRVFDGVVQQVRCVGVVGPGDALTTWCGEANVAASFLADRGLEPVVIELGADTGSASIRPQASGWTLGSNGCSAPVATILGGVDPGALAVTSVICRGSEAFLGVGMSLFGPGVAPDGGGILAAAGDEGWNVLDFGTSISCSGQPDGVDRCALFGVEAELFEALLPLPPVDALGETSVDIVGVADRTADVEAWIAGATDPGEIEAIVTAQLLDPEAEVQGVSRRSEAIQSGRFELLVVEIPQLDDSIATETWAIWIGTRDSTGGVTAFSWSTCARGVTGDGLCV